MKNGGPVSPIDRSTFRGGEYSFALTGDPAAVQLAQAAFDDLPADVPAQHAWQLSRSGEFIDLAIDDRVVFSNVHESTFLSYLTSSLTRQVLDHQPSFLHLHALCVVRSGGALVAAGPSGAGKSTLAAALLTEGAAYCSDESVAVDPDTATATTFAKPLVIKRRGVANVARIVGFDPPHEPMPAWVLPASSIGQLSNNGPHRVATLVWYSRTSTGSANVVPMHRASMAHQLLLDSPDVSRFGPKALSVIARLVANATCLSATGSDARETARVLLDHHAQSTRGTNADPTRLPAATPTDAPHRSAQASSVVIDGRALVMNTTTEQLVELDEQTTSWWQLLDGTAVEDLVDEISTTTGLPVRQVADIGARVVADLSALNLLTDPT